MREVIDYYKNFENGFYKERTRNKKEFICRGNVTIQLYKEGELVEEVKSENCICEKWVSALYLDFINEVFMKSTRQYLNGELLKYLVLSTNNKEEDPLDIFTHGEKIGYANVNDAYSGADTLRGTVNLAESSKSKWSRHIVIDFPTHAANGTFNSIYMGAKEKCGEFSNVYDSKNVPNTSDFNLVSNLNILLNIKDKKYYFINNGKLEVYIIGDKNPILQQTLDLPTSYVGRKMFQGKTYKGRIYVKYLYDSKIIIYNEIDLVKENEINLDIPKVYEYIFVNDYLYLIGEENKEIGLYKYTMQGTRIKKLSDLIVNDYIGIGYVMYNYKTSIYIPISNSDVHSGNKAYKFDCETETITLINENIFSFTPYRNYYYDSEWYCLVSCFIKQNEIYVSTFAKKGNSGIHPYKNYFIVKPYISHTKLPAPVTKTSANTMKIQYDYEIEPKEVFE